MSEGNKVAEFLQGQLQSTAENSQDVKDLIDEVIRTKELKDQCSADLDSAKSDFDKAKKALSTAMNDLGVDSIDRGGYSFKLEEAFYFNVKKADHQNRNEWLRENGFGSLIKETVNASTFKSTMAEFVKKNGKEALPEFISLFAPKEVKPTKKRGVK